MELQSTEKLQTETQMLLLEQRGERLANADDAISGSSRQFRPAVRVCDVLGDGSREVESVAAHGTTVAFIDIGGDRGAEAVSFSCLKKHLSLPLH